MNILVVDDSKTIQRMLQNLLKHKLPDANIDVADDGRQAYKLIQTTNYALVLTDWNMPVMNGLELVVAIRNIGMKMPIWMITTEGGRNEVVTALRAGVNNYIVKPIQKETLYTKLDDLSLA